MTRNSRLFISVFALVLMTLVTVYSFRGKAQSISAMTKRVNVPYVVRGIPTKTSTPTATRTTTQTPTPTRSATPSRTPTRTPTARSCDGYSQALTNPSFEFGLTPWYPQGDPIWTCFVATDGTCSVYFGGRNLGTDSIYQIVTVPSWAETGAVYFDWAMLSDDSTITPRDYLTVSVMLVSSDTLPRTIAHSQIDNTDIRNTWFTSKLNIANINQYIGKNLSVMVYANTSASLPTGWHIDNVRLYFACGSWIASEESTLHNNMASDEYQGR